ncbi:MAG: alpha/beta fold hydrolase [Pseudomonadales bacterium]|nr:alpha/beta fold hydrolase [Pseudomonadales bacterium]
MFSIEDSIKLRESLSPFEFNGPSNLNDLAHAYCEHYGLSFDQNLPLQSHRIGLLRSGDFDLVCQHFSVSLEQQRGTVFLVHGYFDHTGLYGHLIKHCLQQGLSVIAFDLPGHGLSSGPQASIDSFNQYSDALSRIISEAEYQQVNKPWFAIGQSTGAATIVNGIIEKKFPLREFEQSIFLAPLVYPKHWTRTRFLFAAVRWFISSTRRNFASNSHDQEFLNFLRNSDELQSKKLPREWVISMLDYHRRLRRFETIDCPVSIIQGTDDQTVEWGRNIKQLETKFSGVKTYLINGGRHHLVNESQEFRDAVFSLIDQIIEQ